MAIWTVNARIQRWQGLHPPFPAKLHSFLAGLVDKGTWCVQVGTMQAKGGKACSICSLGVGLSNFGTCKVKGEYRVCLPVQRRGVYAQWESNADTGLYIHYKEKSMQTLLYTGVTFFFFFFPSLFQLFIATLGILTIQIKITKIIWQANKIYKLQWHIIKLQ